MEQPSAKIELEHIYKSFRQPDKSCLEVLTDLSLKAVGGCIVAITGASGSGKSTLLHIMGSLDAPDSGDIRVDGASILSFNRKEQGYYRNQRVGFVFQFHYLMPELSVLENVAFPRLLQRFDKEAAYAGAEGILAEVGLREKLNNMPGQLSGGERQRAAIARALINSPDILLADEPTGNLDWKTGEKVFNLFREMLKIRALTSVIVTHNEQLAGLADYRYHLQEGKLNAY